MVSMLITTFVLPFTCRLVKYRYLSVRKILETVSGELWAVCLMTHF